jgi:hypothetical protein
MVANGIVWLLLSFPKLNIFDTFNKSTASSCYVFLNVNFFLIDNFSDKFIFQIRYNKIFLCYYRLLRILNESKKSPAQTWEHREEMGY